MEGNARPIGALSAGGLTNEHHAGTERAVQSALNRLAFPHPFAEDADCGFGRQLVKPLIEGGPIAHFLFRFLLEMRFPRKVKWGRKVSIDDS